MNRRTASRALAAFCALALVGCNGGEPQAEGSSTTTSASASSATTTTAPSSPTTKPTPTASVSIPAAARAHTDEGAKAFAQFYMEELSEAYASLDLSTVRAFAAPACSGCQILFKSLQERKSRGERSAGRSFTAELAGIRPGSSQNLLEIDVAGTEESVDVIDGAGSVIRRTTAGKVTFRTVVQWDSNRWTMKDLKAVTG